MAQNTWLYFSDVESARLKLSGYTRAALDVVEENIPVREEIEFIATGEVADMFSDVFDGVLVLTDKAIYVGHTDNKTNKAYASWVSRDDPAALDRLRDRGNKAVYRTNGVSAQTVSISGESANRFEQVLAAPPEPDEVRAARKARERAEQEEARLHAEQVAAERQRELEQERENRRQLKEARRLEREKEIDAMPPAKRWVLRNIPIVVGATAVLVLGLIFGSLTIARGIQEERVQQAAAAAEAQANQDRAAAQEAAEEKRKEAQEAADQERVAAEAELDAQYQAALNSCDPDSYEVEPDFDLFAAWANCPSIEARLWTATNADSPIEVLEQLASDDTEEVRVGIASNLNAPESALGELASDASAQVRAAVAGNRRAPESQLRKLVRDPEIQVRRALIFPRSREILRPIAESDPSPRLRKLAMEQMFGSLCGKNLSLATYVAGTKWQGNLAPGLTEGDRALVFGEDCKVTYLSKPDDRSGSNWGKWQQNGSRITWEPGNKYTATVSGNTMTGRSGNGPFRIRKVS
jgi:hypothetical protein